MTVCAYTSAKVVTLNQIVAQNVLSVPVPLARAAMEKKPSQNNIHHDKMCVLYSVNRVDCVTAWTHSIENNPKPNTRSVWSQVSVILCGMLMM